MRRTTACILMGILCMAIAMAANAEEARQPYLLWDIPFGIPLEEYAGRLTDELGMNFWFDGEPAGYFSAAGDAVHTVWGLPVYIYGSAGFNSDGEPSGLASVRLAFDSKVSQICGIEDPYTIRGVNRSEAEELFAERVGWHHRILEGLCKWYGKPTGGLMEIDGKSYDYPLQYDILDSERIIEIMLEGTSIRLTTQINNVIITGILTPSLSPEHCGIRVDTTVTFLDPDMHILMDYLPAPLTGFHGEDGTYGD